jgi:hypothetical protein
VLFLDGDDLVEGTAIADQSDGVHAGGDEK